MHELDGGRLRGKVLAILRKLNGEEDLGSENYAHLWCGCMEGDMYKHYPEKEKQVLEDMLELFGEEGDEYRRQM